MGARRRKGFTKTLAEDIALELRDELGLNLHQRLDPYALAAHLSIDILTVSDLVDAARGDRDHLVAGKGRGIFSAATIFIDKYKRGIILNPGHAETRKGNSICHEIGHVVLEHPPTPLPSPGAPRSWDPEQENQADYVAGALLIPRDAAHEAGKQGKTDEEVANQFGVSLALARMRMNKTGARLRAKRLADMRSRW
jgi:Zn-dependent peptidase ImmA (M78 family)